MRVPSPTSRAGKIYLSVWDLLCALASPLLALALRDSLILTQADWSVAVTYWLLSAAFTILACFAFRLQDGLTRHFSVHEALYIAEAVLFSQLLTCAALFTVTRLDGIPRSMPLIHGVILLTALVGARIVVRLARSGVEEAGFYTHRRERIILVGSGRVASSFIQLLRAIRPYSEPVIAVVDEDRAMAGRSVAGIQVLGAPHELDAIISEFAIHGVTTDRVVIAGEADALSPAVLEEVERVCLHRQIELSFLPRMIGLTSWDSTATGSPVAHAKPPFPVPSYFRTQAFDRRCGIHRVARSFPASVGDGRRLGSSGCRAADLLLAGAPRLEGTAVSDLQIPDSWIAL